MIRFGIRYLETCFKKFINFELSSQIYIKVKELDYLPKNQLFFIVYIQKILDEKTCRDAIFINFPSFVTYIGKISYFYSKQLLVISFCNFFCIYFYLFGRFKSLKGTILSDWIRQLEQK